MSLVSIILCTYNGEDYIKDQIDSILSQTYSNFELIISDDCSTDFTVGIINAYSQKDSRIRIIKNKINLGYVKNFEKGISIAKGDYIALSDQDDVWEHNKIEKLYNNINDNALIYCDSALVDENLRSTGRLMSSSKNMISTKNPINLCLENCVSGHALMFKKHLLDNIFPFPKDIPHDWWIAYNATLNGRIVFLNEALVKYRIHNSNSLVLNKGRKSKENKILKRQIRIYEFYKQCPENHISKHVFLDIHNSYKKLSISNNIKKTVIFLKHKNELFAIKKKKNLSLIFYIIKQFNKLK